MTNFIKLLLRHRKLAWTAIAISLALAAYSARTIDVRFQFRDFYDYPGNQHLALFKKDNAQFGDPAGFAVVMVEAPDVFTPSVLGYVRTLTQGLEPVATFSRVLSLTNANAVRGSGDDVVTGQLITEIPQQASQLAELKRFVLGSSLFPRRLVSRDATTTAVLAEMRVPAAFASIPEQEEAVAAVNKVLARHPPPAGITVRVTGAPAIEVGTTAAVIEDQLLLVPLVCIVLSLMLFITFRSLHGVLLCLGAVTVATTWTVGIFSLFGRPVDLVGSVIPISLLVYAVVDPIFVVARFRSKIDLGVAKEDAIVATLSELALPCFLTSLTTSIGFLSFVTCAAPTIQYYGLTVGIGVLLAFVSTVLVLPLLLAAMRAPAKRIVGPRSATVVDRLMDGTWKLIEPRARLLAVGSVVLLGVGTWYASQQTISNAYVNNLPKGQTLSDVHRLEEELFGVIRMVVRLEGARDALKRPEVLQAVERVDSAMEKHPLVTFSASIADLVGEAHQAFQGGDRSQRFVPNSKGLIGQYLTMIDPRDRADVVTDDYAASHIAMLLVDRGSAETRAFGEQLKSVVERENFAQYGIKVAYTGHGVVASREFDGIVIELLWGALVAFSLVIALELVLFRSWRASVLSIVPNLIPVAACFSVMRLFDIPLNINTTLVLCVCIGGLFNTTIHMIARVLQLIASGRRDADRVVLETMRAVGPPSLFTAVILSVGFAVFMFSNFSGLRQLGLLSMITLLSGFVSDLIFTSAFLRTGFGWQRPAPTGAVADETHALPTT